MNASLWRHADKRDVARALPNDQRRDHRSGASIPLHGFIHKEPRSHGAPTRDMASNNGSAGKWEVVKKGKKSSSAGAKTEKKPSGGGRKALGESNQPSRRKSSRPAAARGCYLLFHLASSEQLILNEEVVGEKKKHFKNLDLRIWSCWPWTHHDYSHLIWQASCS